MLISDLNEHFRIYAPNKTIRKKLFILEIPSSREYSFLGSNFFSM
jgi:hypothetical protein